MNLSNLQANYLQRLKKKTKRGAMVMAFGLIEEWPARLTQKATHLKTRSFLRVGKMKGQV